MKNIYWNPSGETPIITDEGDEFWEGEGIGEQGF